MRRVRAHFPGETRDFGYYGERRRYNGDEFDLKDGDPVGSWMVPLNFVPEKVVTRKNYKEDYDYKDFLEFKKGKEAQKSTEPEASENDGSPKEDAEPEDEFTKTEEVESIGREAVADKKDATSLPFSGSDKKELKLKRKTR